jgi:hypothetical protein
MSRPLETRDRTDRLAGLVLSLAIVELTLTTAYIHLSLGGPLFTLNGLGYIALATGVAATSLVPLGRIGWASGLVRIGLAVYVATTIVGYLVLGPYFALGWIAKAVEVAILALLATEWMIVRWRARPDSNRRSPA